MAASSLASVLDDPTLVGDVKAISKVSNARAAWAIAQEWLTIGTAIAFAMYFNAWWSYLPAIVIIGARQHALGILMHDATHFRLFTSRAANDGVSDWLCAFPIGLSTLGYRENHLDHHRATNTPDDPYYNLMVNDATWQWPKTFRQAARHLTAELTGMNTIRNLRMSHPWTALGQWMLHRHEPVLGNRCRYDLVATGAFWLIVAVVLTLVGGWKPFLLLWILPALTFYQLFVQLRWMSEHPYRLSTADGYETRQVKASPLERFCIAPLNINYHIVHHLFPGTPFYRLPQVHKRLMQSPLYREQADIFENYLGPKDSIWAELVMPAGRGSETSHE